MKEKVHKSALLLYGDCFVENEIGITLRGVDEGLMAFGLIQCSL